MEKATNNSSTQRSQEGETVSGLVFVFTISFYSVEALAIILGNVLIILAFWRKRFILRRTSYILMNLAVADLLVGFGQVTYVAFFVLFTQNNEVGIVGLYLAGMPLWTLSSVASLSFLMVVSLESLCSIWWPLHHRISRTIWYYVAIGLVWTIALVFSVFNTIYSGNDPGAVISRLIVERILSFYGIVLVCIICISYVAIWCKTVLRSPNNRNGPIDENTKLAVTLFVVSSVSLFAWIPHFVMNLIELLCEPCVVNSTAHLFGSILFYANSLANPIVYSLRMPEIRRELIRLVCRQRYSVRVQVESSHRRNKKNKETKPVSCFLHSISSLHLNISGPTQNQSVSDTSDCVTTRM